MIDEEKIRVYYNISTQAKIDYYYLKYQDRWHWTRDNIRHHTKFTT